MSVVAKPYKNKDGIWCKRFTAKANKNGAKPRIYLQCPPGYNTLGFLAKMERDALEKHMEGKFTTGATFGAYVRERFMVEYPAAKALKKSSRESLEYLFEKIAIPELGTTPLVSIDAGTVARFTAKLRGKMKKTKKDEEPRRAYSDQTIRLTVVAIVSVLRWAAKLGDIATRPEIEVPKVEHAHRPQPYSADEAKQLQAAAQNETEHAVFRLMFDAGMRKSEILGLCWEQIDFQSHVLTLDRQRYRGDERKTKSGRERRFTMTPEIEKALKRLKRIGAKYVFADVDGNPYPEHWLRWVFARARKKAGLRHTRIHDSRHHFATRFSASGMSVFDLRAVLGHADIRTTQGYVHPAPALPPSI